MKKLRGTFYAAAEDMPLLAAIKLGYFADEGYAVEHVQRRPSTRRVDALIDGTVQFATGLGNRIARAINFGADLKIVCVTMKSGQDPLLSYMQFDTIAELLSYRERAGKKARFAVNGIGCTDHHIALHRLRHTELLSGANSPIEVINNAIEFVEFAGTDDQCSSERRVVEFCKDPEVLDAFLLHSGFDVVSEEMGFTKLMENDAYAEPYCHTPLKGVVVRGEYLKTNWAEVDMLVRTILRGLNWVQTQHKDVLKECMIKWCDYERISGVINQMIEKHLGHPPESPITAETLADRYYKKVMPQFIASGIPEPEHIALLAEIHTDYDSTTPPIDTLVDFGPAERARKST